MKRSENGESRSAGGEKIMLVEDESFVRGVTRAVLESAGYSVIAVGNATEAQQMYDKHSGGIDLLLTDIVLPGEDGRRLAKRFAGMDSGLQVLLVTGYMEEMDVREKEEDHGAILQKPFAAATLLQRIRQLLDRRPRSPVGERVLTRAYDSASLAESAAGSPPESRSC